MVNRERLFGAISTRAERAQVVALPNVGSIRTPNKDISKANIAAAAAIGRAGARARTRVYAREELAELSEYYCATYDRQRMPPAVQQDMVNALDAGMHPEVIMLAMDDAARAYRPSWSYAAAIIRRCLAEGCRTTADWERRKAAHAASYALRRGQHGQQRQGKAIQDYAQREYRDEDFAVDAVMQMWMEEQGKAPNSAK